MISLWFRNWGPQLGINSWCSIPVPRQFWGEQEVCVSTRLSCLRIFCQKFEACACLISNSTLCWRLPGIPKAPKKTAPSKRSRNFPMNKARRTEVGTKGLSVESSRDGSGAPPAETQLTGIWEVSPCTRTDYHLIPTTHPWWGRGVHTSCAEGPT